MADISITIPAPSLTAGQYFKERHRLLPVGTWSGQTNRTNAPFTITGLSVGDYEFEFVLVNADGTHCPPVYRTYTLVGDYDCLTFASQMQKQNGLYHVEVTYTLPPGFTDPACGWEIEYVQNGVYNKFTYANLPVSGIIKIPCANLSGILYIRALMCNGRVKECHSNDVAYYPDPPCVPISGVVITFEEVPNFEWCDYYINISFTQSTPATTVLKLEYFQWNAVGGDKFKGTVNIAPGTNKIRRKIAPLFFDGQECTKYYVTLIDVCNNGLPIEVDWCRTLCTHAT